jgi:hypothetical protein
MIVTIATVGYGDIVPTNWLSRLVIMAVIVLALSLFPFLIGSIIEALKLFSSAS